jgi:hypothetical protein
VRKWDSELVRQFDSAGSEVKVQSGSETRQRTGSHWAPGSGTLKQWDSSADRR